MEEPEIKYIGIKDMDDFEKAELTLLVENGYAALKKKARLKEAQLSVSVKKTSKTGERHNYRVILKLNAAGTRKAWFDVRHEDWELARAVHRCFDALTSLMQHELKRQFRK